MGGCASLTVCMRFSSCFDGQTNINVHTLLWMLIGQCCWTCFYVLVNHAWQWCREREWRMTGEEKAGNGWNRKVFIVRCLCAVLGGKERTTQNWIISKWTWNKDANEGRTSSHIIREIKFIFSFFKLFFLIYQNSCNENEWKNES